ncbi:MAG TPA: D-glucuronyl C5-epimerase family protein [Kofleriaceae bacterium]|nr:D-glucuronyl C5-epimerase family protein [Kofleriaceae bacterium]
MERVSDALFRVARWRRQLRLIASDPLALEPLVEPHARQLGFAHVCVASLDDTVLSTYDTGHTSLYDQRAGSRVTPSCVFYTWVHARQLAAFARITGRPQLLAWARRWRGYTQGAEHRAVTALECLGYRARSLPRYIGLSELASHVMTVRRQFSRIRATRVGSV